MINAIHKDERFSVWQALSELFLDTKLSECDYESIANILANSDYSLKELEAILLYEVFPVCKNNLLCVAGEWAGFNDDWLIENISPRKDKRPLFNFNPFNKRMFVREWIQISDRINDKRKEKQATS